MRALKFAGALAAALLVHLVGVGLAPGFSRSVDLFLVLVVLNALGGSSLAGLGGGLAAGFVHDALTGGVFGLYGFADTIVGYGVARLAQRLVIQRAAGLLLVAALASVAQGAILVAVGFFLLPASGLPDPRWILTRAVTSGLLGAALFAAGRRWRSASEVRRRTRVRRLKMD